MLANDGRWGGHGPAPWVGVGLRRGPAEGIISLYVRRDACDEVKRGRNGNAWWRWCSAGVVKMLEDTERESRKMQGWPRVGMVVVGLKLRCREYCSGVLLRGIIRRVSWV